MDIKKIFLEGLLNIQSGNFKLQSHKLKQFFNNNKNEILKILDEKETQAEVSKTINFLHENKRDFYLSTIYLELLSEKFPNNLELKLILSKTYYQCQLLKLALISIESIPKKIYTYEHYKLLINIYSKSKNYLKCIDAINQIRLLEGMNLINTLIMINSFLGLRKIEEAKIELKYLEINYPDSFEFFYHELLVELAENKFEFVLTKIENLKKMYSNKEFRFHEIYSLVLRKFKRFQEAIENIEIAKSLGMDDEASYLYSLYLSDNQFDKGLFYYEKATQNELNENFFEINNIKKWNNENLENTNLFIYCGIGVALGDRIFFYRYFLNLTQNYKTLNVYMIINNLRDQYLFNGERIKLITSGEVSNIINKKDLSAYYSSIAGIAKIYYENFSYNLLNHKKFLPTNDEKKAFWNNYFKQFKGKFKIGLNWKGDGKYKLDIYRSIKLEDLRVIFEIKKITYFILNNQINDEEKKFLSQFKNVILIENKLLKDEAKNAFSETLEIMRIMDLIISTDTSIAHIAASLNLRTFLMLEYSPFWYWKDKSENNYYQNTQLEYFNQNTPGNWNFVINEIKNKLIKI